MSVKCAQQEKKGESSDYRDKEILNYLIVIVGFGLCRAWIVICLVAPVQIVISTGSWMFLVSGALVAFFISCASKRFKKYLGRLRCTLFVICGVSLVLSAIIIPVSLSQEILFLGFLGFLIGGIGAGTLQVLWGERFAFFEIKFATIASPAAAILTALFIALFSVEVSLLGYVFLPILSFILLCVIAGRTDVYIKDFFKEQRLFFAEADSGHPEKKVTKRVNKKKLISEDVCCEETQKQKREKTFGTEVGKLMFSIMVFSFICRIFDAIPLDGKDPFLFCGGSPVFSLVVVGTIFLLFAAAFKDRFNPVFTYRLSLPCMVAGLIAIVLLFDAHAALSVLLINIGYEFFDILAWILFTEISRRKNEDPLHIFGLGVTFMFVGMSLGILGSEIISLLVLSGDIQITVIAMLCTLCLVIVGFLVIPEGTIENLGQVIKPDKKEETRAIPSEARIEDNCVAVADFYRLTPRESEVLVLLAQGRTLSIIARDLHIAKGTARTHMENIYRKLDVHKQQDLIDLVSEHPSR